MPCWVGPMSTETSSMANSWPGPEDLRPVLELEGEVVQLAGRPVDERDVVHLVAPSAEPGSDVLAVIVERGLDALGGVEVEDLAEEPVGELDVVGGQQRVFHPRRADADEVAREDLRVDVADFGADEGHVVVQLELVRGRQGDPDTVADLGVLSGG